MYTRILDDDIQSNSSDSLRRQVSIHASLVQILSEMGFASDFIEVAIAYTNSTNIDELLAFLIKGNRGWEHEFVRN